MSKKHPIISVTGSSGAGTTSIRKTFEQIFRREKVKAAFIEGDAFHRYDRKGMQRIIEEESRKGQAHFSHFGPEANLFEELAERIVKGPITFRLLVQLANPGDVVDDATIHWPEDRQLLELGTIVLTQPVADNASEQKQIIFDPIARVDGIEASADPLLELRAAIYLISGRRRRSAPKSA